MKTMRRIISGLVLLLFAVVPSVQTQAQTQIVTTVVKKVLMAIDLEVQRMQNKTIWLQNAQRELENVLSQTKVIIHDVSFFYFR